ncbi:sialate O-acetylesterase [Maribacter chungangensis]|uniref:Sialate O-acetylesterase n=1 Tax=Maribacter chungangensis TaxID=1069117 RepID=A0ABW3B2R6_9FLAO
MKTKLFLLSIVSFIQFAYADITLPRIFGDNMVLQRESEVYLYGWASPNETFNITTGWDGKTIEVKTGINAKWRVQVTTPKAGGPYEIEFNGNKNTIKLKNVLIGEVWLASGQSNMEWSANSGIVDAATEIQNARYPNIRLFTVDKRTATTPQEYVSGDWEICSPETMADFSAVAYFFARRVQEEMNIPVGLIDASWGASSAEVWTPEYVFDEHPQLKESHKLIKTNQWAPIERSTLYNAMIAPLTNFKISGALWYQGESNTANAQSYKDLFTKMIMSWRKEWGADFPFYYVQIAPYNYGRAHEGAIVRDQQRRALTLPNTGMVVTSDICTVDDIHPQNKQDVGLRLANIALKEHFNVLKTEVYGPLFKNFETNDRELLVHLDHANGLHFKAKSDSFFEIAGADGVYHTAKPKIRNNTVVLTAKQVSVPVSVRFAWGNTDIPGLFNAAELPTSTFSSN